MLLTIHSLLLPAQLRTWVGLSIDAMNAITGTGS